MFLQRYAFVLTLPAKKSSMQDVQSPDSFKEHIADQTQTLD